MHGLHEHAAVRARRLAGGLVALLAAVIALHGPKDAAAASLPDWPWYRQAYALSCEAASLQMALRYEGFADSQSDLLGRMGDDGRSGYYDYNGTLRWGNAFKVFVGNVNGSENNLTGYGTYWPVVQRVADSFSSNVVLSAGTGISPATLYADVAAGDPTQVWVTADWAYHGLGHWLTFDGSTWIPYAGPVEHSVDVIGVSATQVLIADPIGGQGSAAHPAPLYWLAKSTFESSYATYRDMAVVYQPLSAGSGWVHLSGSAYDVGAGGGRMFAIGTNPAPGGYGIWRWDGGGWTSYGGGGTRIAVDPQANPWVVNSLGAIWHWAGGGWAPTAGPPDPANPGQQLSATDIGVGGDGSVFVIASDAVPGGFGIWKLAGGAWQQLDGGATRISVDASGNPWVINDGNVIYARISGGWVPMPGTAVDVGSGPATWIASGQAAPGGYVPEGWSNGTWVSAGGGVTGIAVGQHGEAYAVNSDTAIYEHLSI